jgi:hypothetical protein
MVLAEHLVALEVARGDDEILQGVALQVVHHHVDGFVLAEEVQHRLTTLGWLICASERPSSKKLFRPRRYSGCLSGLTRGVSSPGERSASEAAGTP